MNRIDRHFWFKKKLRKWFPYRLNVHNAQRIVSETHSKLGEEKTQWTIRHAGCAMINAVILYKVNKTVFAYFFSVLFLFRFFVCPFVYFICLFSSVLLSYKQTEHFFKDSIKNVCVRAWDKVRCLFTTNTMDVLTQLRTKCLFVEKKIIYI